MPGRLLQGLRERVQFHRLFAQARVGRRQRHDAVGDFDQRIAHVGELSGEVIVRHRAGSVPRPPVRMLAIAAAMALCAVTVHEVTLQAVNTAYSCGGTFNPIESNGAAFWVKKIAANGTLEQSGGCQAISGTPSLYIWNETTADDQSIKFNISAGGGSGGPMVRMATDGSDASGYFCFVSGMNLTRIFSRTSAANTDRSAGGWSHTYSAGDPIECRAVGNVISAYAGVTLLGTYTDTSTSGHALYTTGQTGFYNAGAFMASFVMTDVGGAAPTLHNLSLMGVGAFFYLPTLHAPQQR